MTQKGLIGFIIFVLVGAVIIFGQSLFFNKGEIGKGKQAPVAVRGDVFEGAPEVSEEAVPAKKEQFGPVLQIGKTAVKIEIADTKEKLTRGLGGRESLPQDAGMLFVFGVSNYWTFWMKDMRFALDFVWMNEDFEVVHITKNVLPESYPEEFSPPEPVKYVLEVNAGFADDKGIKVGNVAVLKN